MRTNKSGIFGPLKHPEPPQTNKQTNVLIWVEYIVYESIGRIFISNFPKARVEPMLTHPKHQKLHQRASVPMLYSYVSVYLKYKSRHMNPILRKMLLTPTNPGCFGPIPIQSGRFGPVSGNILTRIIF